MVLNRALVFKPKLTRLCVFEFDASHICAKGGESSTKSHRAFVLKSKRNGAVVLKSTACIVLSL